MAGESRTELLGWINDLLQLNYTKVILSLSLSLLLECTPTDSYSFFRSNNAVHLTLPFLLSFNNERRNTDPLLPLSLGTGAVYCQIFDSIYQDLPMTRVKFDAKSHEYLTNYKILQASFKKHGLDKVNPSPLFLTSTSRQR